VSVKLRIAVLLLLALVVSAIADEDCDTCGIHPVLNKPSIPNQSSMNQALHAASDPLIQSPILMLPEGAVRCSSDFQNNRLDLTHFEILLKTLRKTRG
jgi:hypothetical protein